jgi:uncharacterized membrane protein
MLMSIVITLVVLGIILYAINTFIPMDPKIKQILNFAVVVIVIFWLLFTILPTAHLPAGLR